MTTLTDFLLARIAEDEAVARAAADGPWTFHPVSELHDDAAGWVGSPGPTTRSGVFVAEVSNCVEGLDDGGHIARFHPARVLAECEAKRAILALHSGGVHRCITGRVTWAGECPEARLLALPYADHPDYREEWKP